MGRFAGPIFQGNSTVTATGLRFGPDGNLYVAAQATNHDLNAPPGAIMKFNGMTGARMGTFVSGGSGSIYYPNGIAFGPDDNLYVANNNPAPSNNVLAFNVRTGGLVANFVTGVVGPSPNNPQFLLFATSTPPPSTSGSPPPSTSGSLAAEVAALSAQATALQSTVAASLSSFATLQAQITALQANDATTQTNVAALQSQVAKLEGQITMADLAGTYTYVGIQNELVPPSLTSPAEVGAYVYTGTVTLAADGTGSGNIVQKGSYLTFSQPSLSSADQAPGPATFTWAYSNGVFTVLSASDPKLNGATLNVAAGGRVMVTAGANENNTNHRLGTDWLIMLTRLD